MKEIERVFLVSSAAAGWERFGIRANLPKDKFVSIKVAEHPAPKKGGCTFGLHLSPKTSKSFQNFIFSPESSL